jgi:two-component system cell cycle sensor histidine kinase/response regulator CckA
MRGATILVVDDEASVVELVRTMLWRAGFTVIEAGSPDEALHTASEHPTAIELLLTDILMPGMNGYELAERVTAQHPESKVLFMSGYRDKVLAESTGRAAAGGPFLRKPFTQHTLVAKIEEVLSGVAQSAR